MVGIITRRSIIVAVLVGSCASAHAQASTDDIWRATSRFGYGPTPALVAEIATAGNARHWSLRQIDVAHAASQNPADIPEWAKRAGLPLAEIFPDFLKEREARKAGQEKLQKTQEGGPVGRGNAPFSARVARDSAAWRLLACSSPDLENPVLARMTEFWFNHLNVFSGKGPVRPFVGNYVLDVIRKHALGKYEDLLLASARHPAMLFYLDQAQSVAEGRRGHRGNASGLNENYARELLELHTLGVDGGYTQTDVRELARIMTGWTVAPQRDDGFRFDAQTHADGEKRLLGTVFTPRGVQEGEAAIRMLARHSATARRIAGRMASFFVSDQPSPALVKRLAQSFTESGGDIRTVLRTLVSLPEFWQSNQQLIKTPFDFACSSLAALGGIRSPGQAAPALSYLAQAGQPVNGWQTPDGYKTDMATWLSPEALIQRTDFALAIGARSHAPSFLLGFLSAQSRQRIAQEASGLRAGLMLSTPEFMRK
jgi:uncharacterized protein (DUF1800 family)